MVDETFLPLIERNIATLNDHFKEKGLVAGVDIKWYFERYENNEDSH